MLAKLCQVILLAALANAAVVKDVKADAENYRLPDNYDVSEYLIDLTVPKDALEATGTSFTGTVTITFTLKIVAANIQLHAPFKTIDTKLTDAKGVAISIDTPTLNEVTSILTIKPTKDNFAAQQYKLTITYTGELKTNMQGFYKSSYKDANDKDEYLLTTQFEPVSAREAFPCFDEPRFKAEFVITITYPTGYTALSNTKQQAEPAATDENFTKVTFARTPKMSTYLIAFTISKFTSTPKISNEVTYGVWSQPLTENERSLAEQYGPIILEQLGTVTGLDYKSHGLTKMDQVAIPDFNAGAMENYGLVTYRESALLYNEAESTVIDRQRTLTVIAHEFAHMWFGDLVTLEWWQYTFLNEGFAQLYEYLTIEQISALNTDEKWEFSNQFVVDQVQSAFLADSSKSSLALTSEVNSPEEISNKFGTIGYNKAAAVLRMLYNTIGSDKFSAGIKEYLTTNQQGNTNPSHLWTALEKQTLTDLLPKSKTLTDVMAEWINKAGFPVVTVSANGDNVVLTQKRFLYEGEEDTKWYVPISYTTSLGSNDFSTTKTWLTPDGDLTLENALKDASWIIFNNKEMGYYRVNYDSNLWSKIRDVLISADRTKIDVLNRAQIVDDVFNLAKADQLKYSEVFNVINFLKDETDYVPWYSAVNGFNSLINKFAVDSDVEKALKNRQLQLLQNVYKSVPIDTLKPKEQVYTRKQVMVLEQMCKLGDESCISAAKELFETVKNGTFLEVREGIKNLKSVVYCNGLRYSTDQAADYKILWDLFQSTPYATERNTILTALGCTKNTDQLKTYLEQSINPQSTIRKQDISRVWSSVINSNSEGIDVALDYFIDKYEDIIAYNSGSLQTLSTIASAFTKQEQIDKLEAFSKKDGLDASIKTVAETSVVSAKSNLNWVAKVKNDFEVYFDLKGAAPGHLGSILVIIPLLFVSILFAY